MERNEMVVENEYVVDWLVGLV